MNSVRTSQFLCLFFSLILISCNDNLAPVTESKDYFYPSSSLQSPQTHRVQRGETLYGIAFRYDMDYKALADLNHIQAPYALRVGQIIHVHLIRQRDQPTPSPKRTYSKIKQSFNYLPTRRRAHSVARWLWPVRGRIVTSFVPEQGKKGINIACKKGAAIAATSDGVVAYAGNGLTGYGNLIIIKHTHNYLSAYGNNAQIMVSEGQRVKAGQVIARAGLIERKYAGVHFEIRHSGVPVNPLNYL